MQYIISTAKNLLPYWGVCKNIEPGKMFQHCLTKTYCWFTNGRNCSTLFDTTGFVVHMFGNMSNKTWIETMNICYFFNKNVEQTWVSKCLTFAKQQKCWNFQAWIDVVPGCSACNWLVNNYFLGFVKLMCTGKRGGGGGVNQKSFRWGGSTLSSYHLLFYIPFCQKIYHF